MQGTTPFLHTHTVIQSHTIKMASSAVRIEPLNDENFLIWSRMLHALLVEKDLSDTLVEGAEVTPSMNLKAIATMTLHCSPHLLHLLDPALTARAVYTNLARHFAGRQTVRLIQLKKELAGLKLEKNEAITKYYGRALVIREKLAMAGVSVSDTDMKLQVLAGLPDSFSAVTEAIECSEISLSDMVRRLEATDARINRTKLANQAEKAAEGGALTVVAAKSITGPACNKCGGRGHWARECPNGRRQNYGNSGNDFTRQHNGSGCWACGKAGHIARNCPSKASGSANIAEVSEGIALINCCEFIDSESTPVRTCSTVDAVSIARKAAANALKRTHTRAAKARHDALEYGTVL